MAITCPNGHVNDEGNRFCDQCGARLEAAPAVAAQPAPSSPVSGSASGGMACPTCGQENLPGTAFCENCGAPLQPPQPAPQSAEAAPAAAPAGQVSAGGVRCPNCGAENDASNAFCEQCGAALPGEATAAGTPSQSGEGTGTAGGVTPTADSAGAPATVEPPTVEGGAQAVPATSPEEEASPSGSAPVEAAPPQVEPVPSPMAEAIPSAGPEATAIPMPAPIPVPSPSPAPAPELTPAPEPTPAQPAPIAAGPESAAQGEVCPNCGASVPPNAKFCMECGTRIERQPQMVRPTHCQNCGAELPPNAKFCLECGTKVEMIPAGTEKTSGQVPTSATPLPSAPSTAQPAPQPAEPATAPTARTYDAQGAAPAAAPVAAPPQAPSAPTAAPAQPATQQAGGPRLVGSDGAVISLPPKNELVVGREDPISGIHPDVDMTAHGGEAGGVSRRHALLRQQNGQWSVTDLDSTNFTRVDGSRAAPHTEVPLQDGSRIQFGRIEFVFHGQ